MDARQPKARAEIAARLRARKEEIEAALATRIYAIAEPPEKIDPDYLQGLRSALSSALEFALEAVERGERRAPEVPLSLLAQARMAARNGVSLDTVLRRYVAGYALMSEYILEEIDAESGQVPALRPVMRGQAAILDRLIATVSEEYTREDGGLLRSTAGRRAERVRRLLDGEPIDSSDIGYELDICHLGLVASGRDAERAVRRLATELDMQFLWVHGNGQRVWAWFGRRGPIGNKETNRAMEIGASAAELDVVLAFGEPNGGSHGWRLTHRQATAALLVAHGRGARVLRYADVALVASVVGDRLLVESLQQIYLRPLSEAPDGGAALRETLRAYHAAGRSVTSTAAMMGLNRQTVYNRLRSAEEKLGRAIDTCAAELETALKLEPWTNATSGGHSHSSQRANPL